MYVGAFTSRNAYVEFTNLSLDYAGAKSGSGSGSPIAIIIIVAVLAAIAVCAFVVLKKKSGK